VTARGSSLLQSRRRRPFAGAGLLVGAAVLGACAAASNGLASKRPSQILSAAAAAVSQATSVRITGTVLAGGHAAGVDMTLFKGGSADGTFSFSGSVGSIVTTRHDVYVKGPASFWRSLGVGVFSQSLAARLAGHWVKLPSSAQSGVSSFSIEGLVKALRTGTGHATKVGTRTVRGERAVGVSSASDTLWIATTGTAYPVEVERREKGMTEKLTFSAWDKGAPPTAPAGAKTLQQLFGLGQ
jgi:hypothetical protein